MWKALWYRLVARRAPAAVKHPIRRAVLRLERLEDRLTPSDLTGSIKGTTLTLNESGSNDSITITNAGSFQMFSVTSSGGTNYTTPTPVTKIVLNLSGSGNTVTLDGTTNNGVISLSGGLTITGGSGNTISADEVYLPGSAALNISLGGGAADNTTFTDCNVGGAATIHNTGSGDTSFTITTSSNNKAAYNSWGSLSITNGSGTDNNTIQDTDFAHGVNISNGAGGSSTVFSAHNSKGLLSVGGNLSISTTSGQSDSEVYDYNVQGGVNINAGTGGSGASIIGLESKQTNALLPAIGGSTSLSGGGSGGLSVDVGGTVGNDYPIVLHGNLAIATSGTGADNITLNDITAVVSSLTSINLGSASNGDTVNIYGDQATATLGSLSITAAGNGTNTFNLQTQKGTLYVAGSAMFSFNGGTQNVNVGNTQNSGIVQTTGNFGVGGSPTSVTTIAQDDVFGGLNFAMVNGTANTTFTDDTVTGAAVVNHTGSGNTSLTINVSSSNANLLNNWNSLSITNGTGQDINSITDTDFGGNVSINNGAVPPAPASTPAARPSSPLPRTRDCSTSAAACRSPPAPANPTPRSTTTTSTAASISTPATASTARACPASSASRTSKPSPAPACPSSAAPRRSPAALPTAAA